MTLNVAPSQTQEQVKGAKDQDTGWKSFGGTAEEISRRCVYATVAI